MTLFRPQIFEANSPTRQTAEQSLWFPIVARYLRIFPTKWQKQIKLRVEFYGCPIRDAVQGRRDWIDQKCYVIIKVLN